MIAALTSVSNADCVCDVLVESYLKLDETRICNICASIISARTVRILSLDNSFFKLLFSEVVKLLEY